MRVPRRPSLVAAFAFASAMLAASPARADGRAEVEKARASYLARNWDEAESRLRALVDPKTGLKERALVSQARMYLGAVLLAEGKRQEAIDAFEKLVLEDPTFDPDPLSFPGDVIDTFIDTRAQLNDRIKNAAVTAAKLEAERRAREEAEREKQRVWLEKVKAQAQEEKITVRNSRLVASTPFGVGQFQNGQPVLGWVFLGTEAALVAASAITVPMYVYARDREQEERNGLNIERKAEQYGQRADDIQLVNLGLVSGLGVVAAIGILQANLVFKPEREEIKKRELPPLGRATPVRVHPIAAPMAGGGAYVGLSGVAF